MKSTFKNLLITIAILLLAGISRPVLAGDKEKDNDCSHITFIVRIVDNCFKETDCDYFTADLYVIVYFYDGTEPNIDQHYSVETGTYQFEYCYNGDFSPEPSVYMYLSKTDCHDEMWCYPDDGGGGFHVDGVGPYEIYRIIHP